MDHDDPYVNNGEFAPLVDLEPWGDMPYYKNMYKYLAGNLRATKKK
jgi:hypothetical protein